MLHFEFYSFWFENALFRSEGLRGTWFVLEILTKLCLPKKLFWILQLDQTEPTYSWFLYIEP